MSTLVSLLLLSLLALATAAAQQVPDRPGSANQQEFEDAVGARMSPFRAVDVENATDLKRIEDLLSAKDISAQVKGGALASAASYGDVDLVELLIRKGVNVNYEEPQRRQTVLMLAAAYGFYVQCGNDPMVTSYPGNAKIVKGLLDAGARLNEVNEDGNTALMLAAQNARSDSVKLLLEAGANVHVQNKYGWTALIYAANSSGSYSQANLKEIVNGLIAAGADVNARDAEGKTAFSYAAGSAVLTEILISVGAIK